MSYTPYKPRKKKEEKFVLLTVSDIRKQRLAKAARNHTTYKEILTLCYNKIKSKVDLRGRSIEFSLPPIISNRPMYNINHACNYMCVKLEKGGFKVSRISDALLFIEW